MIESRPGEAGRARRTLLVARTGIIAVLCVTELSVWRGRSGTRVPEGGPRGRFGGVVRSPLKFVRRLKVDGVWEACGRCRVR